MPFPQKLLKMNITAILARFGRYDSKLKVKLLYDRAFHSQQFGQYMYFSLAIITLSDSKFSEKNCTFEMLYLEKYMCQKSGFLGDNEAKAVF